MTSQNLSCNLYRVRHFTGRLLIALLFVPMLAPGVVFAAWHKHEFEVMGTQASVELWHSNAAEAAKFMKKVEAEMRRIESVMSPYIENSELSLINRFAAARAVELSDEMYFLLKRSLHFGDMSNGAFDISFASVGHLYDYRAAEKPAPKMLSEKLAAVDFRSIRLSENSDGQAVVRFSREGMKIDLGGIAKGYAVDRCIALLAENGVNSALVSAGGDSRMLGDRGVHPQSGEQLSWVIGVRHPREKDAAAFRLPLSDTAISTSGDYERFFDEAGQRFHHILVPETGESASGVVSVSVIGPASIDCDALSTTLFVLGVEKGIALIDTLAEYDAIIIDAQGKVHYSAGLAAGEN